MVVDSAPTVDDGIPRGVRIAGAWAWRLILFVAAAYLLLRLIGVLSVVVIPVVVALLLAALFEPAAAALRRRGVNRSLAAGLVLVTGLLVVGGGLTLIVQTFVSQFDDLATQVGEGVDEIQTWLVQGPLHLSQAQLSAGVDRLGQEATKNQGALTSGALSTAATLGEVVAGFFVVLFTLFFFLRDGSQIWRFLCRLLPRPARVPTARAGHYSWHTLVSYVRATVLVAFVDAVGIGIGLAVLRCRLPCRWPPWCFLSAFIPVIGRTCRRRRVLVALVTQGPVTALILLGIVIGVQQLEGHVLQPSSWDAPSPCTLSPSSWPSPPVWLPRASSAGSSPSRCWPSATPPSGTSPTTRRRTTPDREPPGTEAHRP
jgi:predicted PurR-regulated permease PerM